MLTSQAAESDTKVLLTTLKDAVKLTAIKGLPLDRIYYLDIGIEITHGKDELTDRIHSVLRG